MTQFVTSEEALEVCLNYLKTKRVPYTAYEDRIHTELQSLGFFTKEPHRIEVLGHDDEVAISALLSSRLPHGFEDTLIELYALSEGRIELSSKEELVWDCVIDADDIASFGDISAIFDCLDREAFIAESLLDLYAKSGRELTLSHPIGFYTDGKKGEIPAISGFGFTGSYGCA